MKGNSFMFPNTSEYSTPLSDIAIVDFSKVLAGPFATLLLADLSTSVFKVRRLLWQ